MDNYQVHVPVKDYRGSDPKKRQKLLEQHRVARKLQEYLQEVYDELAPGGTIAVMAHSAGTKIGEDGEIVRRLMCGMQGGSNGITFMKPDANGSYFTH